MSKIISLAERNDYLSNFNNNQIQTYVSIFVNERKGFQVEPLQSPSTFQYFTRPITIKIEERIKSFQIIFWNQLNIYTIPGGIQNLKFVIEYMNNKVVQYNNLFSYNDRGLITLKSIVEKESMQELKNTQLKKYVMDLLSDNTNELVEAINKTYEKSEDQLTDERGKNENLNRQKQIIDTITNAKKIFERRIKDWQVNRNFRLLHFKGLNHQLSPEHNDSLTEEQIKKFQYYCKKIKEKFYKTSSEKPIVNKIKIIEEIVDSNWKAPKSSNGILQRVSADFIVFYSVNEHTSQNIAKLLKQQSKQGKQILTHMKQTCREELCLRGYLVRKTLKLNEECRICKNKIDPKCQCYMNLKSYENEVQALCYIRNLNTESVATYFFGGDYESSNEGIKNTILYSTYYPKSLSGTKKEKVILKDKQILLTILKILEGLQKLHTICLIHRDLKPDNILIDNKKMPKIIDFGSAWVNQNNESIQNKLNPKLYTTKKYNLYYEEAPSQHYKMTKQQYERHPLYDMHAIGKIIEELSKESRLNVFIRKNLDWLFNKCIFNDPSQRIDAENAFYFCGLLLKYYSTSTKIISN